MFYFKEIAKNFNGSQTVVVKDLHFLPLRTLRLMREYEILFIPIDVYLANKRPYAATAAILFYMPHPHPHVPLQAYRPFTTRRLEFTS